MTRNTDKPANKREKSREKANLRAAKKPPRAKRTDAGVSKAIDNHPRREEIVKDLIDGKTQAYVARKYDIDDSSVFRFLTGTLAERAAKAMEERQKADGDIYVDRLEENYIRLMKLYDACDDYLKDPANPEKYDLNPRAWEMDITYREFEDETERPVKKKKNMQTLIEQLEAGGLEVIEIKYVHADPRKLIIDTALALKGYLHEVCEIKQIIKDTMNITYNFNFFKSWNTMKTIILQATEGNPKVRQAIIDGVEATLVEEPRR